MKKYRLARIVVKTGVAEKAGLYSVGGIDHNKVVNEVRRIIERDDTDYIALIPDINVPLSDIILSSIGDLLSSDVDAIIVVSRPQGPLSGFFSKLGALDILKKITGNPRGYLMVFKKDLVKGGLGEVGEISNYILSRARRIYKLVYTIPLSEHILAVYGRLPYPIVLMLKEPKRILKFGIVGGLGALVNISVVVSTAKILGYTAGKTGLLLLPVIAGFETSITFNFILHELWTFREMNLSRSIKDRLTRLFKYHLSSLASLVIQALTILGLTDIFHIDLATSTALGIMFGFIANYIIGRTITWQYR